MVFVVRPCRLLCRAHFLFLVSAVILTISCTFSLVFACIIYMFVYMCAFTARTLYNERKKRPNTIAFGRGLTQLRWHDSEYRTRISISFISFDIMCWRLLYFSHLYIHSGRPNVCVCVCVSARAVPCVSYSFSLPSAGFTIFGFIPG